VSTSKRFSRRILCDRDPHEMRRPLERDLRRLEVRFGSAIREERRERPTLALGKGLEQGGRPALLFDGRQLSSWRATTLVGHERSLLRRIVPAHTLRRRRRWPRGCLAGHP